MSSNGKTTMNFNVAELEILHAALQEQVADLEYVLSFPYDKNWPRVHNEAKLAKLQKMQRRISFAMKRLNKVVKVSD